MLATLTSNNRGSYILEITHRDELVAYAKNVKKDLKSQIINLTCTHYTVFEPNIKFKVGKKTIIIGNIEKNQFIGTAANKDLQCNDILDLTQIGSNDFEELELGLAGYTLG
jgi:glutamate racemase